MNQSVTSSMGRQWLSNLTPASTSLVSFAGNLDGRRAQDQLPQAIVADIIEVTKASRHDFLTESIYNQLQGIGSPATSVLSDLEIPSMNKIESSAPNHEIVFVSIPNLGEDGSLTGQLTNQASQTSIQNSSPETGLEFDVYPDAAPAIATVVAAFASAPGVQNETPVDAACEDSKTCETDVADKTPKFVGGEVGILVEKIIDRFPLASPTVLLFVGGEPNPNVDETCAQVASALAKCRVGNVLLIDGDVEGRQLTIAGGMVHQPGLSEAINRSADWRPLVVSEGSASFSFLPVGVCPSDRWNSDELLRKMTAEMKQDYQFICVSAGDAHAKHAKLWCDVCDGSYLVVSLKNSNETLAKSAAEELMLNGARVLGCVVADEH